MSDYRGDTSGDGPRRVDVGPAHHGHTEHRSGGGIGRWLLILLALLAILAAIGFATGFFRADVDAPEISVKGGDVDLDSKKIELDTKAATIEVPKIEVETTKEKVEVPTLEVSEGKDDRDGADKN